jgi:lysyl oxidase/hemolysin type calcium-binding protein
LLEGHFTQSLTFGCIRAFLSRISLQQRRAQCKYRVIEWVVIGPGSCAFLSERSIEMRRAVFPIPLLAVVIAMLLASAVALAAVINGTSGDDVLEGTSKPDTLYGYEGNDQLNGYAGKDVLWGGPGSDVSRGGGNNDTIHGEGGRDTLYGGGGDDQLYDTGDTETDTFSCGAGNDVVYAEFNDSVSADCETKNVSDNPDGDRLPDLSMKTPRDIQIQTTTDGRRLLRFATIIVNNGLGPFEVSGQRPDTSTTDMSVTQHIYNGASDYRNHATSAGMFYSGDGHDHWHVRDLEEYELLANGSEKLRSGAKQGFCFYDNWNNWKDRTAAPDPYYLGCENGNPNALNVTMGLSRGWGDLYGPNLFGQYIDITGLSDGKYRLQTSADKLNWFLESDETNNVSWVDIQITGDTVEILEYGPNAPTVS